MKDSLERGGNVHNQKEDIEATGQGDMDTISPKKEKEGVAKDSSEEMRKESDQELQERERQIKKLEIAEEFLVRGFRNRIVVERGIGGYTHGERPSMDPDSDWAKAVKEGKDELKDTEWVFYLTTSDAVLEKLSGLTGKSKAELIEKYDKMLGL